MPFRQKDEKPGREGEWKELLFPEVSNDTPLVEVTIGGRYAIGERDRPHLVGSEVATTY
jgi:hypothetical protein